MPLLRYIRSLKPNDIVDLLGRENVVRRAEAYAEERRLDEIWVDGSSLRAHVSGSSATPYHCVLRLHDGELEPECSCPYTRGICWHVGATLMTLVAEPTMIDGLERQAARTSDVVTPTASSSEPVPATITRPSLPGDAPPSFSASAPTSSVLPKGELSALETHLLTMPKYRLTRFLLDLAAHDPIVVSKLTALSQDPTDLDLRLYRQAALAGLRPGRFLRRFEVPKVAADVRHIVRSISRLLGGGNPERALDLMQEIAWLGWARLEESDDRDGVLCAMIQDILLEWARAWSEIPSRDRQVLAREIFAWVMEDSGAVTTRLIVEAKEALGAAGLQALRELLVPLIEQRRAVRPLVLGGSEDDVHPDPLAERVESALREVAEALGDLDGFLTLCRPDGRDGHGVLVAATRLVREGRIEDALRWLERGLAFARGTDRASIEDLRIKLLVHLDRRREAADAAWESFLREPGAAGYRRLLDSVGETTRGEWKRRALDSVEASADATAFVSVVVAAEDVERFAHRLETAPHSIFAASVRTLERAAQAFRDRHPEIAARLHVHLAERVLADGDPRRYERALDHLNHAQHEFEAASSPMWSSEIVRLRKAYQIVGTWYPEA